MVYPAPYIRRRVAEFINFKLNEPKIVKIECDSIPQKVDIRPKRYNIDYDIKIIL